LAHESGAPGDIVHTYDAQDRYVARTENGDTERYFYDSGYRRTSVERDATRPTSRPRPTPTNLLIGTSTSRIPTASSRIGTTRPRAR
jgi:hypothetical protein